MRLRSIAGTLSLPHRRRGGPLAVWALAMKFFRRRPADDVLRDLSARRRGATLGGHARSPFDMPTHARRAVYGQGSGAGATPLHHRARMFCWCTSLLVSKGEKRESGAKKGFLDVAAGDCVAHNERVGLRRASVGGDCNPPAERCRSRHGCAIYEGSSVRAERRRGI